MWPEVRHVMAKDILRFHCVFWPAMLMSAGYDVPKQIFVHGYLLVDERKMSKSLGNVIDPLDLVGTYGADAVRFWALRSVSFGQDGTVSLDSLHERYERELGNELGNLLSRTTAMIARYRGGTLRPVEGTGEHTADDLGVASLAAAVAERIDVFDLTGALEAIWEVVRSLNRHVERRKPWELAKHPAAERELEAVLRSLAEGLRTVAIALQAFLPETSAGILRSLRQDPTDVAWGAMETGSARAFEGIEPAPPLFPRIEQDASAVA